MRGMKRLLLLLPLLLSAYGTTVDCLRCDAMFRAKARVEARLKDVVSDPAPSKDLLMEFTVKILSELEVKLS